MADPVYRHPAHARALTSSLPGELRLVKAHILDFDGDLYGATRSTDLLERLRPDERFESLDALVAQMAVDKARAREVLAREGTASATSPGS